MRWIGDHWLDILGWGGSALLVFSLLQTRVLRFRVLNLTACVILIVFNALIAVWPMMGMNAVLAAINIWFIVKLVRERHDEAVFQVLEVAPDDEYLRHVLRVHGADILGFQPDFVWDTGAPGQHAFLVQRADETVGVVLLHVDGDTAQVLLDYVTPRFRDFSPGKFVYENSGLFDRMGVRRIQTSGDPHYLQRMGFRPDGAVWTRLVRQ